MKYKFTHKRPPRVKSRPRRGKGRTYTERQVVVEETTLKAAYDGVKFSGPISVEITLHKDSIDVQIEDRPEPVVYLRGDVDNYAKLVLDGLNGAAYDDDSQITELTIRKAAA